MAKTTKALSGAAKDAYLKRVIRTETGLSETVGDRLTKRLQSDVTFLRLRIDALPSRNGLSLETVAAASQPADVDDPDASLANLPFDPFTPNVIVVLRTAGREAALEALAAIETADHLHLLAREQQLSITPDLALATEIRHAIVSAAERRIAGRRAAAS